MDYLERMVVIWCQAISCYFCGTSTLYIHTVATVITFLIHLQGLFGMEWVKVFCTFSHTDVYTNATVNMLIMSWVSAVSSISIKYYQMHSARSLTKTSASKCNSCSNIYNVRIHHQTQWVQMELKLWYNNCIHFRTQRVQVELNEY